MTALGGATTVAVLGYLVQCSTLGGAITVRAPLGGSEGSIFAVEDIDGNAGLSPITVLGNGSQLDDAPSFLINQGFGYSTWVYDRGQWRRLVTRRRLDGVGSDKVVNAGGGLNARALLLEFAADDATSGGAAAGDEVPLLADLLLVDDALEGDQTSVRVLSLASDFILDKTSSEPFDPLTVLPTLSGVGRWLRVQAVAPHWTNRSLWFQRAAGNDEWDGSAAVNTPGTLIGPIRTAKEFSRRMRAMKAPPSPSGALYVFDTDGLLASDEFRPSGAILENSNGNNVFDIQIQGSGSRVLVAGIVGAGGFVATSGNVQASVDLGTPAAAAVGQMIEFATGAVAWVTKDLGGNTAQISDPYTLTGAGFAAALAAGGALPIAGTAFNLVSLPSMACGFDGIGTPTMRYRFVDLDFGLSGGTDLVQPRGCSISLTRCKVQRVINPAFGGAVTFQVVGVFMTGASPVPYPAFGPCAFVGSGLVNVEFQPVCVAGYSGLDFVDCHIEGGFVRSISAPGPATVFGGAANAVATARGFFTVSGTRGLGVFNAPAGKSGVMLKRGAFLQVGGPLYGAGNAAFGLECGEGSMVGILSSVTPTITGVTAALQLAGSATALPALEASAGAVLPALAPLAAWADWVAAPFNRAARNSATGAAIFSVT